MTPSPTPIDVFIHSGPVDGWQVLAALGPLAVLLGALVAGIIGWRTLRQRTRADNRAEWWKRTQWALDSSMSKDPRIAKMGLHVLTVLAGSELASPEELEIIAAASEEPLDKSAQQASAAPVDEALKGDDNENE